MASCWRFFSVFFAFTVFTCGAFAQNEVDALRYSYTETPVSVRSSGMGGAFGALGSDLSSFWTNPGGIGVYKRGGIEFGLGYHDIATAAEYSGLNTKNDRSNFTFQNIGIVGKKTLNSSDFGPLIMGVAYGKINNFYQSISIHGKNISSTMTDVFANQANGTAYAEVYNSFPFGAGLAWDTYMIDPLDTNSNTYVSAVSGTDVEQAKSIKRKGAMSETVFGMGTSYRDVLFMGASLGFQGVRYQEDNTYTETYGVNDVVAKFNYVEKLNVTGTGINLKLGVLVKATPWLRLGAAYHSKTVIGLSDVYSASMESSFKNNTKYSQESPDNSINYSVSAPSRVMGNIAFVLGDYGVVAADYEYINFSKIKMRSTGLDNDYDFKIENETIHTIYKGTHRARAGVEVRIAHDWRARAGASYQQSPFVSGTAGNTPFLSLSMGGGYRRDALSVDLGVVFKMNSEHYYLYDPQLVDPTTLAIQRVSIMVGMGYRFE